MSVALKKSVRKTPRYSIPIPCHIQVIKSPLQAQTRIADLSVKGMSFYWDSQIFPKFSEVRIQIFAGNGQPVFAVGRISNVRTEGQAVRYAVRFEYPLSQESMDAVLEAASVIKRAA